jgi:hypothetical protein
MFKDTLNYRERNNITLKNFMQLLIKIKNKVNLDDENEILGMIDNGIQENKTSEFSMYS